MELYIPEKIELDEVSQALIRDVEETARRVNKDRPLPEAVVKRIEDALLGERVYSSNAVEGNTLELRETVMILTKGLVSGPRKREAMEARNLGEAVQAISDLVGSGASAHSAEHFLDIHRKILREIDDPKAGVYRKDQVMIQGAVHQPPDHARVPALVEQVMSGLRQPGATNTLVLSTWAHWAVARIHPFYDGNGRLARLWQDLVLLQGKWTCAIIGPADRRDYFDALGQADDGDFNPLIQLVAQRVSTTFDKYLAEVSRDEKVDAWATGLVGESASRAEEKRKLDYMRWSRKMTHLRGEFEVCAARINKGSKDISVQVRKYDLVDQVRWENIASGLGGEKTWFFTVDFSRKQVLRQYCFFFGKHYWSDLDTQEERSQERVCLLVSENAGAGRFVQLDEIESCPISLREVFVVDDHLVRGRMDRTKNEIVYDREVPALQVAQDFIKEVILGRLA